MQSNPNRGTTKKHNKIWILKQGLICSFILSNHIILARIILDLEPIPVALCERLCTPWIGLLPWTITSRGNLYGPVYLLGVAGSASASQSMVQP